MIASYKPMSPAPLAKYHTFQYHTDNRGSKNKEEYEREFMIFRTDWGVMSLGMAFLVDISSVER